MRLGVVVQSVGKYSHNGNFLFFPTATTLVFSAKRKTFTALTPFCVFGVAEFVAAVGPTLSSIRSKEKIRQETQAFVH